MRATIMAMAALLAVSCGRSAPSANAAPQGKEDLKKRVSDAFTKAGDWLVSQQDKSGAWMQGPPGKQSPSIGLTCLAIHALAEAPKDLREHFKDAIDKGCSFVMTQKKDDGSFGEGPQGAYLKTYATAIALMALHAVDKDKYGDAIRGAQAYLKKNQLREGPEKGGMGYGDKEIENKGGKSTVEEMKANLSTTGFTAEALKESGLPKDDEFWKLVVQFVRKCQNNSETNKDPEWIAELKKKGLSVGDDGGLYYAPTTDSDEQKARTKKIIDKEVISSYGSMTYEGIKTYLYAGLNKNSPEVKAAVDWARKNYTLDSHPGFPYDKEKREHLMGLFYYYVTMARALDALGEPDFKTFDGKSHDWAREMAEQFLKTMKDGKMWVNEQPRWWENDPILVTSYVLGTCNVLMKNIK